MTTLSLFQEEELKTVDVAIPLPVNDPFTYEVSDDLLKRITPGCRVKVPFRNRTLTGFAVAVDTKRILKRPKKILEIIDEMPLISEHHMRLGKWISDYYFSSWGEAISNMMPKYQKPKRKTKKAAEKPAEEVIEQKQAFTLTDEQEIAFSEIKKSLSSNQFSDLFLFGVTGGGKSELYIRAIKEVLAKNKSAIVLVPEIALTEQLKYFFYHHFHADLEILHSKLTDRERFLAWERISKAEKRVVLGPRSAVFAPTPDLGLIIMDEEQEGSYKQDRSPRYHAREVARWRAKDLGIPFLSGTATPTLETMQRVRENRTRMLTLTGRIDKRPMPEVRIVDLEQARQINKRNIIVSAQLQKAIAETLQNRGGILILLNRRGFSTHIRCSGCKKALYCPHCAVALTFHQDEGELICHYCNHHIEVPSRCPMCKHDLFKFIGVGTEKVESEIARLFPTARVGRLDTDTAKKKGAHQEILSNFRNQKIDILVGTQMIAKGFDFKHVTLVGVISADTGLALPDFRSSERTFQLLTQMAGRTGRGDEPGRVIVQTYSPTHYSIQYAAKHEYIGFFEEEIKKRQALNYPPFTNLINIIMRSKKESLVKEHVEEFAVLIRNSTEPNDIEVLGPAPLPIYRLRGHFRWHVMLRGKDFSLLTESLKSALEQYRKKTGVYLAVDVDPVSIL